MMMTTRSGPISAADFPASQVLFPALAREHCRISEHASTASKTSRSAELGRVRRLMQSARKVGAENLPRRTTQN